MRKIAILGTAQTTLGQAPVNDPDWEIWGCGGGSFKILPRFDRWFELHSPALIKSLNEEYHGWLGQLSQPLYTMGPVAEWPASKPYPREEVIARFSDWFMTSSIAWMLALAIHEEPDTIGIWGVDMSHDSEYAKQRAGCLHFIRLAVAHGIDVKIPPTSQLLHIGKPYPDVCDDPALRVLAARKAGLEAQMSAIAEQETQLMQARHRTAGALDEISALERQMAGLR